MGTVIRFAHGVMICLIESICTFAINAVSGLNGVSLILHKSYMHRAINSSMPRSPIHDLREPLEKELILRKEASTQKDEEQLICIVLLTPVIDKNEEK